VVEIDLKVPTRGFEPRAGSVCLNRIPGLISGASAGLGCRDVRESVEVGLIGRLPGKPG
jgi:hypothetical protein